MSSPAPKPQPAEKPFLWQVELTNRCPYQCIGCPRPLSGRPTGLMAFDVFDSCVQAVRDVQKTARPMGLHHFGESLFHPRLTTFVRHAHENGVPVMLACNPEPLTFELGQALLKAGLKRIVLSLDALDTSLLKKLRGPAADYQLARRNILAFLDARDGLNPDCEIRIQMVSYRANAHQHGQFLEEWGRPGVYAYIKKFDAWTRPEMSALGNEPMKVRCAFPFQSLTVLWDGRVVPCCHDCNGDLVLGHISDGIDAVWNGDLMNDLRQRAREGRFPPGHLCARCTWRPGRTA